MRRPRNTFQTKEPDKASEKKKKELNETEISNLSDKEFIVIVIKMLTELGKRMDELGENVNKETEKCKKEPIRTKEYNN